MRRMRYRDARGRFIGRADAIARSVRGSDRLETATTNAEEALARLLAAKTARTAAKWAAVFERESALGRKAERDLARKTARVTARERDRAAAQAALEAAEFDGYYEVEIGIDYQ